MTLSKISFYWMKKESRARRGDYLNFFRTSHVHWFLVVLDHDTRIVTSLDLATSVSFNSESFMTKVKRVVTIYRRHEHSLSLSILFPPRTPRPLPFFIPFPRRVMHAASSSSRAAPDRYSFNLPRLLFDARLSSKSSFPNFVPFTSNRCLVYSRQFRIRMLWTIGQRDKNLVVATLA